MWIAVLTTAINDALGGDNYLTRQTARRWFQHGGRSFELVCDLANFNPDFVRQKILQAIAVIDTQPSLPVHVRRLPGRPPRQKAALTVLTRA
ncbi:MAG: hypothetical protein HQM06_01470 [Magnetococcales bacterium]|nr:hypothetical protein [Magnetococcales bacterium]